MEMIGDYFCWLEGQTEGDAKVVRSDSIKEAAKMAVDSLRHEGSIDSMQPSFTVFVRDAEGIVHIVNVRQDLYLDQSGPRV